MTCDRCGRPRARVGSEERRNLATGEVVRAAYWQCQNRACGHILGAVESSNPGRQGVPGRTGVAPD